MFQNCKIYRAPGAGLFWELSPVWITGKFPYPDVVIDRSGLKIE